MRAPALALLALVCAGAAAPAEVEGVWSFKTEPFDGGCVMTGRLLVKAAIKGVHPCTIEAHEKCPQIAGDALESCTLTRNGAQVTITSKILKGPANAAYYPDDFDLAFESASRMRGRLRSGGGGGPALFYRGPAAVS